MKIVYDRLTNTIEFNENEVGIIVIENVKFFNTFLFDMYSQKISNNDYPFKIINKDNNKNIFKIVPLIFNPFGLDVNNNQVAKVIEKEIINSMNENYEEYLNISNQLFIYMDEVIDNLPIAVNISGEIDSKRLIKSFNISVEDDSENVVEKIINYINVMVKLEISDTFIFVNLKKFLDIIELSELYKHCILEKVKLVSIEVKNAEKIDYEKIFLIDDDLCEIH